MKRQKTMMTILNIALVPIIAFEYFCLIWFWSGDGWFNLIFVPVFFTAIAAILLLFRRKYKNNRAINLGLIYSTILLTPILAVGFTYLLAFICQIQIDIA